MKEPGGPPLPHLRDFLIADQVFQQSGGKWCIIGVFDRVSAHRFPAVHHSLGLYLRLSDARGDYDVRVEMEDSSGRRLAKIEGIKLSTKDPLAEVGFGIQAHGLPLPAPGTYYFKLFFNDQVFAEDIKLTAVEVPERSAE